MAGNSEDSYDETLTSLSLLDGLRENQSEAWSRLVDLWTPLLFGYCRSRRFSTDDAEEIVQEVLKRVFQGLQGFQRNGRDQRFRFWIMAILRNVIADFYKRTATRPGAVGGSDNMVAVGAIADPVDASESEWFSPARIMTRLLDVIKADFSEQNWRAFELVKLENHTNREAAEKLGMKENAVRQAIFRIRKRLEEEQTQMIG